MRNVRKNTYLSQGFTLIELSLSLVFISILSISIALVISDAVSSYQRGLTLNKINSTGQSVVADMKTAVLNSSTRSMLQECAFKYGLDACETSGDNGYKMIYVVNTAKILDAKGQPLPNIGKQPVSGAFCTGNYSYIWNSGYFFGEQNYKVDGEMASLTGSWPGKNGNLTTETLRNFKLLKVKDDYRKVCRSALQETKYAFRDRAYEFDITSFGSIDEVPIDLLGNSIDSNIAVYNLFAAKPAISNSRQNFFYYVSFILGTTQGGVNVLQSGNYCTPPEEYSSYENFDYCSINKFNFAAQAIGG